MTDIDWMSMVTLHGRSNQRLLDYEPDSLLIGLVRRNNFSVKYVKYVLFKNNQIRTLPTFAMYSLFDKNLAL